MQYAVLDDLHGQDLYEEAARQGGRLDNEKLGKAPDWPRRLRLRIRFNDEESSLKIAMIGSKGIPALFGGIEKHVEEISTRLAGLAMR